MKLFKFENYEEYRNAQILCNKRKLHRTWATEDEIEFLSKIIKEKIPNVSNGLCHGARNNNETKWFSKFLGDQVTMLGTDISPAIKQFGGVQWDFHDMNTEWRSRFDFIYSNSLDHSYDPRKALKTWLACLKSNGFLIVQWTPCGSRDSLLNSVDCFAARLREYEGMAREAGVLKEVLKSGEIRKHDRVFLYWLLIGRKKYIPIL
jgi:SAM-dependent methyltransferase